MTEQVIVCLFVLWGAFCCALGAWLRKLWWARKIRRDFGDFMECSGPESMTSPDDFVADARGERKAKR
jgi:hypothetical protein